MQQGRLVDAALRLEGSDEIADLAERQLGFDWLAFYFIHFHGQLIAYEYQYLASGFASYSTYLASNGTSSFAGLAPPYSSDATVPGISSSLGIIPVMIGIAIFIWLLLVKRRKSQDQKN